MRTRTLVAGLLALGLTLPAAAAATPVGVAVTDRAGDQRNPQLDLRALRVAFDQPTGSLNGTVALAAAPAYPSVDGVTVGLGKTSLQSGVCSPRFDVSISIPDPEDVAGGQTAPDAQLYPGTGDEPIGPLPLVVTGSSFAFTSAGANPAVLGALRGQRLNCVTAHTSVARTFDTADQLAQQPMLSGPRPRCRIASRSARVGRSFRFACKGAPRRVRVSILPRRGRDVFTGAERLRKGRFRVPAFKAIRGRAYISLFTGDTAFARYLVRVR